ncbi:reverse transcriptase domain-containing protein [Tanacetum coccineum]
MMIATTSFIHGEATAAGKKKGHTSWRAQEQSKRHASKRRTPKEILATETGKFKPPPPMVTSVEKRSSNKFYDFHNDKGHSTDECMQLKKQIEELVRAGKLSHLIKEIKQGRDQPKAGNKEVTTKDKSMAIDMIQPWHRVTRQKVTQSFERVSEITFPSLTISSGTEGPLVIEAETGGHMIHRMYVDVGSSTEVLYEHCFNRFRPEIKSQMVPTTTSLTGFSGETIWQLGQLRLLVTIGDADHSTKAWMNFMTVRSLSLYNGIIGRPGIREIQRVPSTTHGMLKFLADERIVTIRSTILIPAECATVATSSKEIPIEAGVHHENFKPSDMIRVQPSVAEHRLNIREGYSPVRQKKRGQAPERAKAIQAEDCYPLPEIDWKVKSLYGHPFKCFLDAYKGYHQIQMAESDEEKTAFHTSQGVYCYTKMPFGLKNAGATYQRLVDKAFDNQVGRNIEVYVNDLVIKSHIEAEMLRDIDETFRTLRKINMKLNPKKLLQLSSPRIIKEVHSLNGKLASLNRFLSKSAEKSMPLFKTLKKCIKKSDFHWTPEAKQAFKQLKQHLSELPLLVATKPKEELIVYLSASNGAISAVLMTERGTVQTPVYFVSRVLQGPELNYTPMKKLVLSLVFVAKRLWRTITKIKRHAGGTQYHIPAKNVGERTDPGGLPYGSGAGLILTRPEGTKFTYTLRFLFTASNNKAEYEALIAGLRISAQMGVRNVQVLVEILNEKSVQEEEVATVVEEEGPTWMTPIMEYLKDGTLPGDRKEASKLRDIVSNNGKQFSDNSFKDWCEKLNITQRFASVKHPQTNGLVERANWSLGEGIKARLGEGNKNWIEELPHVLWAHRTMIKSSHGDTPFSLTYGTEAGIPAEIGMLTVRGVTFRPRDFVYRGNDAIHAVDGGKLGPKWEGPYEVTEALGYGEYRLRSVDGAVLPRTWNIVNLKKCYL